MAVNERRAHVICWMSLHDCYEGITDVPPVHYDAPQSLSGAGLRLPRKSTNPQRTKELRATAKHHDCDVCGKAIRSDARYYLLKRAQ